MMLVTVLLIVIVLLLTAIILMMVTGWPGRQREEMERIGNGLRREMAEQRGDYLQLMKAIRIEIEDAVRESIEKEMAAAAPKSRSRKTARAKAQDASSAHEPVAAEEEADTGSNETPLQAMQIPLFPDKSSNDSAQLVTQPASAINQPEAETIHMGYVDDIPDVE